MRTSKFNIQGEEFLSHSHLDFLDLSRSTITHMHKGSGVTRVQFSGGGGTRGAPLFLGGACQYLNILYPAASNGDLFLSKF